jgi:hypothetical protein
VLLSIYADHGLIGRAELSPEGALRLALALLGCAVPKATTLLRAAASGTNAPDARSA